MGFFDKAKSFLNIGGVTVKLSGVEPQIALQGMITGTVTLNTASDREVLSTKASLMIRRTVQRNDGPEFHDRAILERDICGPFQIKTAEQKVINFSFDYAFERALQAEGGWMAGLARLMSSDSEQLFLVVKADVKGTALDPSDKVRLTVKLP